MLPTHYRTSVMMKAESVLSLKLPSTSTTARKVGVLPDMPIV